MDTRRVGFYIKLVILFLDDDCLQNNNNERTQLMQYLVDKLELKKTPLIFLGYSRGAENALKMAALNKVVLVFSVLF